MSERIPLLASLKETVKKFSDRKTVGRMKTEHSIFIPSSLMLEQSEETQQFIKTVRFINKQEQWKCPVRIEKVAFKDIAGVEFIFTFNSDTEFDEVISEISTRLSEQPSA